MVSGEEMRGKGRIWQVPAHLAIALLFVVVLAACSEETGRSTSGRIDTASYDPNGGPLFTDSISIEGDREEILVREFETPLGFPLGFRTRVPADIIIELVSSGDGDVVRFQAAFGGTVTEAAELSFVVLPARRAESDARTRVSRIAESLGGESSEPPTWASWATAWYRISGESVGFLALGERNGQWFYALLNYPPEFGDGMGPRIDYILRNWRWVDGSAGLIPS